MIPAGRTGGVDTSAQQARWCRAAPDWTSVVVRLGRARVDRLRVGIVVRIVRRCVGFVVGIVGRRLGIVLRRLGRGLVLGLGGVVRLRSYGHLDLGRVDFGSVILGRDGLSLDVSFVD